MKETKENIKKPNEVENLDKNANVEEVAIKNDSKKVESEVVKGEVTTNANSKIKDYLNKDLFADVKRISFSDDSSEELKSENTLSEDYQGTFNDISENQIISAKVIGISDSDVMVDIGFKSEGLINRSEFDNKNLPEIGSNIDIFLEKFEDTDGNITLSKYKADFIKRWDELKHFCDSGEPVSGKIIKRVKGGLVVDLGVIQAFLPGSQADVQPVKNFDDLINKEFDFQIVKVDEVRKNLVVSRKAILEESLNEKRQELMTQIEIGAQLKGVVKNITDFGAFVDLGGVDGLIHITDLSWNRINHPTEILELDQKLNVVILDFDDDKSRIQLGVKQLSKHPWENLDSNLKEGDKVNGKVSVLADYGAFIEITDGVEGLVHVSEMSWSTHLRSAQDFVSVGDSIEAVILSLDREERKMSLGIKQLKSDPWTDITKKYPTGSQHKGKIRNFTNFGVFVELEEGIDGLIYISDLSWTKKIKHPSELFAIEDKIDVVVLELDVEERKLSLGHKQTKKNPWDEYLKKYPLDSVHKFKLESFGERGASIFLNDEISAFVPKKHLLKEDGSSLEVGEEAEFKVIEFNSEFKRIVMSHSATYKKEAVEKKKTKPVAKKDKVDKSTLGDIEALADLKKKMDEKEDK